MKILFIEDEIKLAKNIVSFLEKEHFVIDCYNDGEEGYEAFLSFPDEYSLVILDGNLPGKDGFDICNDLRSNGFTLPILFLTARDSINQRVIGLKSGADDYLIKPFNFDELLARIHALLRRAEKTYHESLEYKDIKLFPETRIVKKNGQELDLTN